MPRSQFPGRCSGTTEGFFFFFFLPSRLQRRLCGHAKMQEKEKVKAALLKEVPKEKDNAEDGAKKEDGKDRMTCVGQYLQSGRASLGGQNGGATKKCHVRYIGQYIQFGQAMREGHWGDSRKKAMCGGCIFLSVARMDPASKPPSLSISLLTASCGRVSSAFSPQVSATGCRLVVFGDFSFLGSSFRRRLPRKPSFRVPSKCVDGCEPYDPGVP